MFRVLPWLLWVLVACDEETSMAVDASTADMAGDMEVLDFEIDRGGDAPIVDASAPDSNVDSGPPITRLRVMTVNVGNLDEVNGGPCPSHPYLGGLCSVAQELIIAERIAEIAPDIAIVGEVVDPARCTEDTWNEDPDRTCTGAPERTPYEQVRRLMGPDYTISCDDRLHSDCAAVRTERGSLVGCESGSLCLGGNETPPHSAACADIGGHTSVSRIGAVFDGRTLNIVVAHPKNATSIEADPCRLAQYREIFEQLVDERPALVAGDFNMDAYRFPEVFESGRYWHTQVGEGTRFTAHNVDGEYPTPTFLGAATLDYVLSDFAAGDCVVLGESRGTERIDGELETMDHRAVVCDLTWPYDE
jgi:hypothetical protein